MSSKLTYYVSGNTAKGSVNYLQSNIRYINKVYVLNHPSATLKTNLLKKIQSNYTTNDAIEVILSPFGKEFLEGVIIREKSLAIVTDSIAINTYPNAVNIDVLSHLTFDEIDDNYFKEKIERWMTSAYNNFSKGLKIHDQLEQIYINEMDFNKANVLADQFINTLLKNVAKKEQAPYTYERLFGTNTKDGAVNVVPNLLKNIKSIYHIKGRAGTGKSVFMNKVAEACKEHGLPIEVYRCSFDPGSIDMVRIPELNVCLFDSTDPHEFTPGSADQIIDLYEGTVTAGTDEKYAEEIDHVTKKYKSYMKKGIDDIKTAGTYHEQQEQVYMEKINTLMIEKEMKRIVSKMDG